MVLPASFTVEAAFIFPIIIFLIVALIQIGFYLHDRIVIEALLHQTVNQAVVQQRNGTSFAEGTLNFQVIAQTGIVDRYFLRTEETQALIDDYIITHSDNLLMCELRNLQVEVSLTRILVKCELSAVKPLLGIPLKISATLMTTEFNIEETVYRPEEISRMAAAIMITAKKVPGVEETLKKFSKIIEKIR